MIRTITSLQIVPLAVLLSLPLAALKSLFKLFLDLYYCWYCRGFSWHKAPETVRETLPFEAIVVVCPHGRANTKSMTT